MKLHEDKELFRDTVIAASEALDIRQAYIEKDYWVTCALRRMADLPDADRLVFKGGTSLTKALRVGRRFSEDIDIAILDAKRLNGNQLKRLMRKTVKGMAVDMAEDKTPGTSRKGANYRKEVYLYPQIGEETGLADEVVSVGRVLIEMSAFANPYPCETKVIGNFIADFWRQVGRDDLVERFGLGDFEINVLAINRTFLEKVVSLMRYSLADDYGRYMPGKIRHFYDIHYLLKDPVCAAYVKSPVFRHDFEELFDHDRKEFDFPKGWLNRTLADSPLLKDPDAAWANLEPVYLREMPALAFAAIPSARQVLTSFKAVASKLR